MRPRSCQELPGSCQELPGAAQELPGAARSCPGAARSCPGDARSFHKLPRRCQEMPRRCQGLPRAVRELPRACQELPAVAQEPPGAAQKFSFPRGSERSEAERGRSNSIDFTCFDSVGHFRACFSISQYLNALPVPMLRQVHVGEGLGLIFPVFSHLQVRSSKVLEKVPQK